jgi:hypothetical protein
LGSPLVALHYLRVEPLRCYLVGHLSYPRDPDFHRSQPHGDLPRPMIAVAITSKLLSSPIAVATQEGVYFFLQHCR